MLLVSCSLSVVGCSLVFNYHYPLPITHYQLPITHYPLPITHYPLPITSKFRILNYQGISISVLLSPKIDWSTKFSMPSHAESCLQAG
ncbi:MAG: hypothetical protein ACKPCK_04030, partial [Dolichospermum sp.]